MMLFLVHRLSKDVLLAVVMFTTKKIISLVAERLSDIEIFLVAVDFYSCIFSALHNRIVELAASLSPAA